jgi:hypothetical protein
MISFFFEKKEENESIRGKPRNLPDLNTKKAARKNVFHQAATK